MVIASVRGLAESPYAALPAQTFDEYSIPRQMIRYGPLSEFLEKQGSAAKN